MLSTSESRVASMVTRLRGMCGLRFSVFCGKGPGSGPRALLELAECFGADARVRIPQRSDKPVVCHASGASPLTRRRLVHAGYGRPERTGRLHGGRMLDGRRDVCRRLVRAHKACSAGHACRQGLVALAPKAVDPLG